MCFPQQYQSYCTGKRGEKICLKNLVTKRLEGFWSDEILVQIFDMIVNKANHRNNTIQFMRHSVTGTGELESGSKLRGGYAE